MPRSGSGRDALCPSDGQAWVLTRPSRTSCMDRSVRKRGLFSRAVARAGGGHGRGGRGAPDARDSVASGVKAPAELVSPIPGSTQWAAFSDARTPDQVLHEDLCRCCPEPGDGVERGLENSRDPLDLFARDAQDERAAFCAVDRWVTRSRPDAIRNISAVD